MVSKGPYRPCVGGHRVVREVTCTTDRSQRPCEGMGSCMRLRNCALISLSVALMRSPRLLRWSWKAPRRDLPQMKMNPRKVNVSGLPRPRFFRLGAGTTCHRVESRASSRAVGPRSRGQLLWDLLASNADLVLVTGDKRLPQDAVMRGRVMSSRAFVAGA